MLTTYTRSIRVSMANLYTRIKVSRFKKIYVRLALVRPLSSGLTIRPEPNIRIANF